MSGTTGRPAYWDEACSVLAAGDPVLAKLIAAYPGISLEGRGDVFVTLCRSIVGQQISVKAADSIWRRFDTCVVEVCSERVLAASVDDLRACGLSQRKVEYLKDLAQHHAEGRLASERLDAMDDEAVIAELTSIRGIGRWTAEMFLMFHLMRPDVLPLDDVGLIKAVARYYHDDERRPKAEVRVLAQRWAPWRSVATWYLWRGLEPLPVSY
ncbi:DNA-3-methyladenine glycosylase family protein [Jeongeupia chitinilytica]|uniref:DNA-3-methyladenine glycosylase II n=1 Tax=Jeongeupia chitinilytica TaxID=1041641 RepID=A0ABQ3GWN7_9NEIS|nr:DNA-3-methyladenine glycosylase [Jeongeupia chitinilytica]GHD58804.1 DNA-3-methyladenine glycosylase [Jeongeupia chitinilytica]